MPRSMHTHGKDMEVLADAIVDFARERIALEDIPLDHPRTEEELQELHEIVEIDYPTILSNGKKARFFQVEVTLN